MSRYSDLLKDPRWQKKRLEVLERDEWMCQHCHDTKSTLHIHHIKYEKGFPWDVDEEFLITLCEDCHERMGMMEFEFKETINLIPSRLSYTHYEEIYRLVFSLVHRSGANPYKIGLIKKFVEKPSDATYRKLKEYING